MSFAGWQPGLSRREGSRGRAEQEEQEEQEERGLSEERRTRAGRPLAPPVVHHAPAACSILRADTTFQDLGLAYIFEGLIL